MPEKLIKKDKYFVLSLNINYAGTRDNEVDKEETCFKEEREKEEKELLHTKRRRIDLWYYIFYIEKCMRIESNAASRSAYIWIAMSMIINISCSLLVESASIITDLIKIRNLVIAFYCRRRR